MRAVKVEAALSELHLQFSIPERTRTMYQRRNPDGRYG